MGQYYKAIVKKNGRMTVYNRNILRDVNCEYTPAKLTEHSWWLNEFVNAVCLDIYERKGNHRVAWVGDYAKSFLHNINRKSFNRLNGKQIARLHEQAWRCEGVAVSPTDFTLSGKYLVNHTKKEYFDGSLYFEKSCMHTKDNGDWCMHPLPLLTCIGNGWGSGDYKSPTADSTKEYIGAWAWNELSIEDIPPAEYVEIYPVFKERGWEEEE